MHALGQGASAKVSCTFISLLLQISIAFYDGVQAVDKTFVQDICAAIRPVEFDQPTLNKVCIRGLLPFSISKVHEKLDCRQGAMLLMHSSLCR
jgi:hypothetical protein